MSIERWLQISLATLASLGTLILGMGQDSPALPLMAVFASATSVLFTDAFGWFRLNRVVANLAALAAAVFSLSNFMFNDSEHQLIAIAHLLVYLQVILLYQHKTYRIYWELAVLSLLQVVVAAALNLGLSFGAMLAPYTIVAIFALLLFYLHRENRRFAGPEPANAPGSSRGARAANRARGPTASNRFGGARGKEFQFPGAALAGNPSSWPAQAREQAALLGVLSGKPQAAPARRRQGQLDQLLGGRLIRLIGAFAAVTAFFTVIVFFATPRQGEAVWRGPVSRARAMVGFSKEISLGRMRDVLQDDALAMRVSLTTAGTVKNFEPVREPYFRGAVLHEYLSQEGEARWRRGRALTPNRLNRKGDQPTWGVVVRQEIVLEPRSDESLFAIHPALQVAETPRDVVRDLRLQQIFRLLEEEADTRAPYRYVLETAAFDDRWQRAVTVREEQDSLPADLLPADSATRFPELKELALKILKDEEVDRSDHLRAAYAVENHFHDTSKFTYSLDLGKVRQTPGLDPIVDFAINHRTGHCQYFASAAALMLRTIGIPCRLVIGYKGGEYNALGKFYQVREKHAHAWVEVWLPPDEISDDMIPRVAQSPGGAWLRIDPTPSSEGPGRQADSRGAFSRAGDVLDYARILWADYVLGLNSKKQHEAIYEPLSNRLAESVSSALDATGWKDAIVRAFDWIGIDVRGAFRGRWFDWRASLAAIVFCLVGFAAYRAAGANVPRLSLWLARRGAAAPARRAPVIEFYRRLEALLARSGLRRRGGQTQREFAHAASNRLRELAAPAEAVSAPLLVAEAFYRVRFGGDELSPQEQSQVERSLAALQAAMTASA